jgi:hypothetical protein
MATILMTINDYSIMVIGGYFINGYWWLLIVIVLMTIDDYSINGYWWIFY